MGEIPDDLLQLAGFLVGDLPAFSIETWGSVARRLLALHSMRHPFAQGADARRLDHDFAAVCEVLSCSAFRSVQGTVKVLGFEDSDSTQREGLALWLAPGAWSELASIAPWHLRQHVQRRALYRLSYEVFLPAGLQREYVLSYWLHVR